MRKLWRVCWDRAREVDNRDTLERRVTGAVADWFGRNLRPLSEDELADLRHVVTAAFRSAHSEQRTALAALHMDFVSRVCSKDRGG